MRPILGDDVEATLKRLFGRQDEPMTAREVAHVLGLSIKTVKRIPPTSLPFFRATGRGDRRYWVRDVRAYIERRTER